MKLKIEVDTQNAKEVDEAIDLLIAVNTKLHEAIAMSVTDHNVKLLNEDFVNAVVK